MGANGEDILLSPLARETVPLSIECKCVEKLNVWSCIEQAEKNTKGVGNEPCLVFSKNRKGAYAVLKWETVLSLLVKSANGSSGASLPSRLVSLLREVESFLPPQGNGKEEDQGEGEGFQIAVQKMFEQDVESE